MTNKEKLFLLIRQISNDPSLDEARKFIKIHELSESICRCCRNYAPTMCLKIYQGDCSTNIEAWLNQEMIEEEFNKRYGFLRRN